VGPWKIGNKDRMQKIIQILMIFFFLITVKMAQGQDQTKRVIKIGSKKFTESVILGEIAAHLFQEAGLLTVHFRELGGTQILWKALLKGEIDLYPEYTGTLKQEILAQMQLESDEALKSALASFGIQMSAVLGFNNTYVLGMQTKTAHSLGIRKISDLRYHPNLKFGFSNEFMDRQDGWRSLRLRYQLPQKEVQGLDHDLAYRGIQEGAIDVVDLYSTDAEIRYHNLRPLNDDLEHFPKYFAVFLYRDTLNKNFPKGILSFQRVMGKINENAMIKMNSRAKLDKIPENRVAADFLKRHLALETKVQEETTMQRFIHNTKVHLNLVGISLGAAILISIPLGLVASRYGFLGQIVLGGVGIIQTIPSLALLVFMIPLLGIGSRPAIVALFLYSLLPIVRNTYTGLLGSPSLFGNPLKLWG